MKILFLAIGPISPLNSGARARMLAVLNELASEHEVGIFSTDISPDFGRYSTFGVPVRFWVKAPAAPFCSRQGIKRCLLRCLGRIHGESLYYWLSRRRPESLSNDNTVDASKLFGARLEAKLEALIGSFKPDAIWCNYSIWAALRPVINARSLKVCETHDSCSLRRQNFVAAKTAIGSFPMTEEQEGRLLDQFDRVIAIEEREGEHFQKISKAKVITIPHLMRVNEVIVSAPSQPTVLFIGADSGANREALKELEREIMPRIKGKSPNAKLLVAGSVGVFSKSADIVCGHIKEISEFWTKGSILINPIRNGSGIKIKNLEALCNGLPVITTNVGAAGFQSGEKTGLFCTDSSEEMARIAVELLTNNLMLTDAKKNALRYAAKSCEESRRNLADLFRF